MKAILRSLFLSVLFFVPVLAWAAAPTVQANNLVFTNLTSSSATLSWTNGNGTSRAVFLKATSTTSLQAPATNTTYTGNVAFGSGSQIATSGFYCVYNGTGSSVNITGLSSNVNYTAEVIEYNGIAGAETYFATSGISNPLVTATNMILAWDFVGQAGSQASNTPTSVVPNLNSTVTVTRGSVNTSVSGSSFSATNFTANGDSTDAVANGKYLQFTVTASTGYSVALSTIDVNFRKSITGPSNFIWKYSLNGFATTGVNIGDVFTSSAATGGTAQTQVPLSSITALQNVVAGKTITFRLYCWGATNVAGTFGFGNLTGNDLAIGGSVSQLPVLTTGAASSITSTTATLAANVSTAGDASLTDEGIVYSTTASPVIGSGTQVSSGTTATGAFSANATGLTAGTAYHYQAYATNSVGTSYGGDQTFTTTAASPTIASSTTTFTAQTANYGTAPTAAAFNVSGTNMTAGVLVTPPTGFEVSTDNITFASTVTVGAAGTIASTPVYVRLKANAVAGTYSGNVALTSSGATEVDVAIPSSTVSAVLPTITDKPISGVTTTAATMNATVTDGGDATTVVFVVGSDPATVSALTNPPTGTGNNLSIAAGAGSTSSNFTDVALAAGTTYYYVVKATNSAGTAVSSVGTFTALPTQPTLTIVGNSATTANLNWVPLNGATSYTYDVATDNAFTATLPGYSNASTTVPGITITGITTTGLVYVRVKAVSAGGSGAYTNTYSFFPLTSPAFTGTYNFNSLTAAAGAQTTDITPVPVVDHSTFGSFSLAGVTSVTTTGRFGASWGSNTAIDLTKYYTVTITPATGYAQSLTGFTFTVARSASTGPSKYSVRSSLDGYTTDLPGTVVSNANLSVSNGIFTNSNSSNALQTGSNITLGTSFANLTAPVTFRIYAFNGTSAAFYIDDVKFTGTTAQLPTVTTTTPATNIATTTVTLSGNLTSAGDASLTDQGIVYSTTANPTIATGIQVSAGTTIVGAFSSNVTGLTVNTTYHYVAYATSAAGTNYGADQTFTTTVAPAPTITSFSPATGPVGTLVTINGANLSSPTALTIGGQPAIIVSNTGSTLVAMVMPNATTGTVVISNTGGSATATGNFTITPTLFPLAQQNTRLTGTSPVNQPLQGSAVAISADGTTAVIGGYTDNTNNGAIWVYTRSGNTWTQQGAKLNVSGYTAYRQGFSVAISADGNTIIQGGYNNGNGAAWVFTRSAGAWSQQARLTGTTTSVSASQFGYSVGLSADGNTAIIGGNADNNNDGAAWIFTRAAGAWTQVGNKLTGNDMSSPRMGSSVALNADGTTAIIGGSDDGGGIGATWVFVLNNGSWVQQGSKLKGTGGSGQPQQGYSVAVSADGNTLATGARLDNTQFGTVWIFTRTGTTWSQQGSKLTPSDGSSDNLFGSSVSLSADGNTLLAGGPAPSSGGAAWVFTRSGSTWAQQRKRILFADAGFSGGISSIGASVSLSADGTTGIIGAPGTDSNIGAAWPVTVLTTPTVQASNISFTNTTTTGTTINWTNGDGNYRSVFMTSTTTGLPAPSDYFYFYRTNYGDGDNIGGNWFAVYEGKNSTVNITGLTAGTNYRVAVLEYNGSTVDINYLTTTGAGNLATVSPGSIATVTTTASATSITATTATLAGNVSSDGNSAVTEKGIVYSTSANPTIADTKVTGGTGTGAISVNVTGLTVSTVYHFRAYATNSIGTAYGADQTVTTASNPAIASTGTLSALSTTYGTASSTGTFSVSGTDMTAGITATAPTGFEVSDNTSTGFGASVTIGAAGTIASTPVYIRLKATAGAAAYSGNVALTSTGATTVNVATVSSTVSKATLIYNALTASINFGDAIPTLSGTLTGFVNSETQAGVTTGTLAWVTTATTSSAAGTYPITGSGLTANGNYTISQNSGNSAALTISAIAATVTTTTPATAVTTTTATLAGNVSSDGSATVTEKGIVYNTTANPTTTNTKVTNGTGTGAISVNVTSLAANTTYHYRAYAINSVGTTYGADQTFTTNPPVPTLTSITATTGTTSGNNVINLPIAGGGTVTLTGTGFLTGMTISTGETLTIVSSTSATYTVAAHAASTVLTPTVTTAGGTSTAGPTLTYASGLNTLDNVGLTSATPSVAAYSLRKLSSTYTGNAITVRRSSDNATANIGFAAGGGLNVTALTTFVGSNTGYVTTWYDQSGKGYNMTQADASRQPVIIVAGTLQKVNNIPTVYFPGDNYQSLYTNASTIFTAGASMVGFAKGNDNAPGTMITKTGDADGNTTYAPAPFDFSNVNGEFYSGAGTNGGYSNIVVSNTTPRSDISINVPASVYSFVIPTTGSFYNYLNGVQISRSPVSGFEDQGAPMYMGNRADDQGVGNFYSSEVILFNGAISDADRQTVEASQKNYYIPSVPPAITSFASTAGRASGNNLIAQPTAGGATITITGTNFLAGMTISTGETVTVVSATSATYTLAAGSTNQIVTPIVTTTNGTSVAGPTIKYFGINTLDLAGLTSASPSAASYSLRKLSSDYSGPAIKVLRSSDNTTADIGFNANGGLDTVAMKTFVGSSNGTVAVWYDQSGNSRDQLQTNSNQQPTIIHSGIIYRRNGQPTLLYDASDDGMYVAGADYMTTLPLTVNIVSGSNNTNTNARRAVQGSNNNWLIGPYGNNDAWFADGWNYTTTGTVWSSTKVENFTVVEPASASVYAYRNGVTQPITGNNKGVPNKLYTGAQGLYSEPLDGYISEVLAFNVEVGSTELLALESNQETAYPGLPVITSLASTTGTSLNNGLVDVPVAGGNTVTITGSNFITGMTISTGETVTVVSRTQATYTLAAGTAGLTVTPTVTTIGGTSASGPVIAYRATPVITSFASTSGSASGNNLINMPATGGAAITITGTSFVPGMTISTGETLTVVSSTSATYALAAGTGGSTATPLVTTTAGTSVAGPTITYSLLPVVTAFTSTSGIPRGNNIINLLGGATINITGANFFSGMTISTGETVTVNSSTSATYTLASQPSGTTVTPTLTTTNGTSVANGSLYYTIADPGNALVFNGTSQKVNVNNTLGNFGTGDFTVEAWIKTTSTGHESFVSKRGVPTYGNFWQLGMINNKLIFDIDAVDVSDYTPVVSNASINDGKWHHLVSVKTATQVKLYIDGLLDITTPMVGNPNISNTANFVIASADYGGLYSNSSIDEVRLYNKALSQADIVSDMLNLTSAAPSNLQAYYNFNASSGTALADIGGTNNGTLVNAPTWTESYAMVVPVSNAATAVTSGSFVANWNAPTVGTVTNYLLDVSTSSTFATALTGSPFTFASPTMSRTIPGLSAATTFYYRVRADKTSVTGQGGYSATQTATTGAATSFITANAPSGTLSTAFGTPSSSAAFNVSGTSIAGSILVAAPVNYEVSLDNTIFTPTATIVGSGTIASTPVYVRLAGSGAAGSLSGTIAVTSSGATEVDVAAPAGTLTGVAPLVTTNTSTNATTTTAKMNATVNDGGLATTVSFEYGALAATVTGGGGTTPGGSGTGLSVAAGSGNSTPVFSATGLTSGNTYYYRVKAVNSAGTTYGSVVSLTTISPAPVITTTAGGAGVTANSISADWSVPNGATSYQYDVSTSNTFATLLYTNVAVNTNSALISGLAASTSYFIRIRAINAGGTSTNSGTISTATLTGTNFTATYDFNALTTATPVSTTDSTAAPVINNATLSKFTLAGATNLATAGRFNANNWGNAVSSAFDATKYFSVTLTPNTSGALTINSFTFTVQRTSSSAPRSYVVRSSVDNYTANLPASVVSNANIGVTSNIFTIATALTSQSGSTITPGSAYAGLTAPVTFRIYAYNDASTGTTGSFSIDNFKFTGTTTGPVVTATGALAALSTIYGTATATPGTLTVGGTSLTNDVLVTPPTGFEVSTSASTGYASTLTLPQTSGTVSNTTVYLRLAATAAVGTYGSNVVISSTNANNATLPITTSTVSAAALTIAATGPAKTQGAALTAGSNTSNFTATGLQNGETITSVTLTPDAAGLSAATTMGTAYVVTPSAPVGAGGFVASNYAITYTPYNGTVAASANPVIATTGTLSALSTTYGTASSTGTFSVSGTDLTAGILVTAPTGFEVSTNNTTGFGATVTVGTGGVIASTPVYIRLKANSAVNSYSGNVALTSAGATTVNVATVSSTISAAAITITASTANKTYGNALTGAAGSTAFTVTSGSLQNSETIGSITLAYSTGAAATDGVGTYTGTVTPSAATGGSFTASNYTITYAKGNIVVGTRAITITATGPTKKYGVALTAGPVTTNFSVSGTLAAGEAVDGVTLTPNAAGLSATTSAGSTYVVTPSLATGTGGFDSNNYNITYLAYNGTVAKTTVLITAANVSKIFGNTLTSGTGFTSFSSAGLAGTETIGSVTVTYGTGNASTDAVGTYTGQVQISAATGGTFNSSNYNFSYAYGNIIVTAVPTPAITVTGNLSAFTGTFGTASASDNFNVSGTNMTAGILVTAPSGFEVSTDNTTFTPTVTIGGAGTISSTLVYVRLASSDNAGNYSVSSVAMSSSGASNASTIIPQSTVSKYNLTITASTANKIYGSALTNGAGSTAYSITTGSLQNSNTITSVSMTYGTGALATDAPGTYTGQVTPSAAVGANGFSASNYNITYAKGNIAVGAAPITITANTANKTYGTALTGAAGSTDFSVTSGSLQNSETIGSVTMAYGTGASASSAVNTYASQATPSLATGGTFNAANYTISYAKGDIVVGKATLTITANDVNKVPGNTLSNYSGSTSFTSTGLQNGESAGTVSITYGTGAASGDAPGTYANQVTPSNRTGGTINTNNYTVNYTSGAIVIGTSSIFTSGSIAALSTTFGTASSSNSFTVAASNLSNNLVITAPTGFEVATSSGVYGATVSLTPSGGIVTGTTIYVRLAATTDVGTYSGNVVVSSTGAASKNVTVASSTVSAYALTITASNANKTYGQTLTGATGSTAYSITSGSLQNGNTISSVSIAYGTGSAATAAATTYAGQVTPSVAVGANGFDTDNYNITYAKGDITVNKASLTVSATGVNKTYDGNKNATVTFNDNRVSGDTFTTDYTATFNNKNVGTGKTVSVSSIAISGGASANYTLSGTTASTTADISIATATVTAQTDTKTYNKTNASSVAPVVTGIVGTDVASTNPTQTFNNANVGTGKTMTATGLVINDGNSGNNYTISYVTNTTGGITTATATVTAQTDNKTYDRSTSSSVSPIVTGLITGDVAGTAPTQTFNNANVGTAKTMTASGLVINDGNSGNNYTISYVANTTGVITTATATVTAQTDTKTYNRSAASAVSPIVTGLFTGDVALTNPTQAFNNANAGVGKTMTASGLVINDGNSGANYTINYVTNTTGVINRAGVTVTAQTDTKTYNKTTASAVSPSVTSLVTGDVIGTQPTQTFNNANVGTAKTLTAAGLVINDGNSGGNYLVSYVANTTGVITTATATVTAQTDTKTYNRSTASAVSPVVTGLFTGDVASTNPTQTFNNANVGTAKTLTAAGLVINDGNSGNNYTISYVPNTTGVITTATATVTAQTDTKTYNRSTASAVSPVVTGLFTGDVASTNPTQTFNNANVGTAKTLTAAGLVINDGNSGNNYTINYVANTTGVITTATATVTAQTDTKTYNKTTASAVAPVVTGLATGDVAGTLPTQTFNNANVGTAKTLTASGLVINDGNSGNNYTINYVANTTGVITTATATVTAQTDTKTYNKTTTSAVAPVVTGLFTGDFASIAPTQTFNNANVGTAKTLTASGLVINDGNSGNNYTINYVANTTGVITTATATVTAQTDTKTYNKTTTSAVAPVVTGLFTGDFASIAPTQTFNNANVGTAKTLTASGLVINDGNSGNNYTINYVPNTTGVITTATATVTAQTDTKTYNKTTASAVAPVVTGLATGDLVSTNPTQTFNNANVGTAKTLTAAGLVINDGNSGNNYTISYVPNTTGVITTATATVTAQTDTKTYNRSTASVVVPVVTGLFTGDVASTNPAQTFNNANVGTAKTLTAAGLVINDGNSGNNYTINYVANTTGVITTATATVTAQTDTKTYNRSTASAVAPVVTGLFTGDVASTNPTQTFNNANVGTAKTLTAAGLVINDGNSGNNYTISYVPNTTGVITTATATVTAQTDTKVYNRSTASAVVPVVTGVFTGDVASTNPTQTFNNANVGTAKTLTAAGLVINDGNSGNNYTISYVPNTTGVITIATATVTAQTDTKTYNRTTASAVAPVVTGLFTGDVASTNPTQTFNNANVGTAKTLTAAGLVINDGNSGNNYTISYVPNTTGVITTATATVTAQTDTKTYNRTTASAVAPVVTGLFTGDVASTNPTQTFNNANVGTAKTLTAAGLVINDGNSGNNYTISYVPNTTGVITTATATVTAQTDTRTYDKTTASSVAPVVTGLVSGDVVGTNATQTFNNANAGTGKVLTPAGMIINDGNSGNNYTISYVKNTTGVITTATATVTAQTDTKTYNRSTASAVAPVVTGLVTGDVAGTAPSQTFNNANVGTGKTLTASGLVINDGNSGNNYTINYVANTTGVITTATATVTAQADTKTYNKTNASSLAPVVTGLATGDVASTNPTQTFNNANAGVGKTMIASGLVINDGNGGANYTINYVTNTTGVINRATVTVTAQADTKTYNKTTASSLVPSVTSLVSGDVIATQPTQTFNTANVGTGKVMTPAGLVINDGNGGGNYLVSYSATGGGVITTATATVTAQTDTKGYDRTNASSIVPVVTGLITGDVIGTQPTQTFNNANAGLGKTMTASGLVINDGNSGSNYTVNYVTNTTGVIIKATATVTAQTDTKAYDRANSSSVTPVVTGLVTGDLIATAPTQTFNNANVGTGKTLTAAGLVINDGNSGNNYTVNYATNTSGVINTATATVTAQADTRLYNRTAASSVVPIVSGLLSGDAIGTAPIQTFNNANAGTGKTITASGLVINDGNGGANYTINYVTSSGNIITALATVTAQSDTRTYNKTTTSAIVPVVTGLFTGDVIATQPTQKFNTANVGTNKTMTPSGLVINDGNGGNNYSISYSAVSTGVITAATATVTAQADTKTYNRSTASAVAPVVTGLATGDLVSTNPTQTFNNANVGTAKTLTAAGLVINDGNSGNNYTISYVPNTTGVITTATATVTAQNDTKVYNRSTASAVVPVVTGVFTGDLASTNPTQTFNNANVGTAKTLTASGLVINDGNGGNNYTISYVPNTTGVITIATATVTAQADTRLYNRTAASSVVPIVSGLLSGDAIGTAPTQTFNNANAGTGKTITASGLVINDGNGGANYTINYVTSSGNIITALATVTAQTDSKTYNKTTASAGVPVVSGLLSGDVIATVPTQTFNNVNVGTGKTLTATGLVINDGNSGNNYSISYVPNTTGVITVATATVTAQTDTKVYNTTNASAGVPVVTGLLSGDVIATTPTQTFNNANVGTGKTLTASGLVINDGNAGNNYTISYVTNTTGAITPVALTYTANTASKIYGATNPALSGTVSGFVGSDNLANSTTGTAVFTTTATTATGAGSYAITGSGLTSANYTFAQAAGNSTAFTIGKANLAAVVANASRLYGSANPSFTVNYIGFIGTDNAAGFTTGPTVTTTATLTSGVGSYPATASGIVSNNYVVTYTAGILAVTQAPLTISVSNASRSYGVANPTFTVNYSGFVGTDNAASLLTQPTVTTSATIASLPGAYVLSAGGASSNNYSISYNQGALTVLPLTNANLAGLTASGVTLSPAFATATTSYTATVPNSVTSITLTPTTVDATATVTVNGVAVNSGSASGTIALVGGANVINTVVTAQDGVTKITYTVTITRTPSNNANLAYLSVTDGGISPQFSSSVFSYTAGVGFAVSNTGVTATLADATATITINGVAANNGSLTNIPGLKIGDNTVTIVVTAQDGVTKQTYVLTIHRASPPETITATNIMTPDGDGVNDNWVIKDIAQYPNNTVTVYDVGGRIIFTKHGYANEWQATINGSPLTEGTYYYVVDLGVDGVKPMKGFITIIRKRK